MSASSNELAKRFEEEIQLQIETIRQNARDRGYLIPSINFNTILPILMNHLYLEEPVRPKLQSHKHDLQNHINMLLQRLKDRAIVKNEEQWWQEILKKTATKMAEVGQRKRNTVVEKAAYDTMIRMVHKSIMYPGFQWGCVRKTCPLDMCVYSRTHRSTSTIIQLTGIVSHCEHDGWIVIAVSNDGETVYMQRLFESELQKVDRGELAIYEMHWAQMPDGYCWEISSETQSHNQPLIQPFPLYTLHPLYINSLHQMIQNYRVLQQKNRSIGVTAMTPEIIFLICQFALNSEPWPWHNTHTPRFARRSRISFNSNVMWLSMAVPCMIVFCCSTIPPRD